MANKKIVKFQIGDMLPIALTLIVAGVAISYGLQIIGETAIQTCRDNGNVWNPTALKCSNNASGYVSMGTAEYNATQDTLLGVSKIPQKLPLLATVITAAVVLGIVVRYLGGNFR